MAREASVNRKKKIEQVRKDRTANCRNIYICSYTSTLHIVVPLIKVLHRLGTVQVISEDKSISLISPQGEQAFRIGDISVEVTDEPLILGSVPFDSLQQFNYNIIISNEFLALGEFKVDKFIILNRRHHFREQIESPEDRYVPMVSVFNPKLYDKPKLEEERGQVYVNEKLLPLPSFSNAEQGLSALEHGYGTREFKFNSAVVGFIVDCLDGIEGCDKTLIRRILLERGEMFVSAD